MASSQLIEIVPARQIEGEPRRRCFVAAALDLIVWCDDAGVPVGFQLCYDKGRSERALTWKAQSGFRHEAVDDGEAAGLRHKATPLLVADGRFDPRRILSLFTRASRALPHEIVEFVRARLEQYSDHAAR